MNSLVTVGRRISLNGQTVVHRARSAPQRRVQRSTGAPRLSPIPAPGRPPSCATKEHKSKKLRLFRLMDAHPQCGSLVLRCIAERASVIREFSQCTSPEASDHADLHGNQERLLPRRSQERENLSKPPAAPTAANPINRVAII